ncbi:MAG: hypothetical protein ACP5OZ_02490 [Candidatus Woesearchaeota archaeon]
MDISFLTGIILILLLIFLIFKFVKTLFKAILVSLLFIIAAFLIFMLLVYNDVSSVRTLPSQRIMFLFVSDNKFQSGFTTVFSKEEFNAMSNEKLSELQRYYNEKNYKKMLSSFAAGNSTTAIRFFVFNEDAIKNAGEKITIEDFELSNEEVLSILKSQKPITAFSSILVKKGRISEGQRTLIEREILSNNTEEEFKAKIFGLTVTSALEKDFSYLIKEYKKKNVIVYPRTPLFYLTSIIPEKMINSVFKKIEASINETNKEQKNKQSS